MNISEIISGMILHESLYYPSWYLIPLGMVRLTVGSQKKMLYNCSSQLKMIDQWLISLPQAAQLSIFLWKISSLATP